MAAQVFLTPDYLAIVMEFATGGDMFQLVVANRGLPEQDARWYFQQLIIAVDYCHKMVSLILKRRRKSFHIGRSLFSHNRPCGTSPCATGCCKSGHQVGEHPSRRHYPASDQDL